LQFGRGTVILSTTQKTVKDSSESYWDSVCEVRRGTPNKSQNPPAITVIWHKVQIGKQKINILPPTNTVIWQKILIGGTKSTYFLRTYCCFEPGIHRMNGFSAGHHQLVDADSDRQDQNALKVLRTVAVSGSVIPNDLYRVCYCFKNLTMKTLLK
jgi:hypothetical protein